MTDGARAIPIDLVPSFQVVDAPFTSSPIDRIRLRAIDAATSDVVGVFDQPVDPAASEWVLSLGVTTGGEALQVIVEIELLSGGGVEWSGRAGPFTVQPGVSTTATTVEVFRGPLDNLDVISVTIVDPPLQLLAGTSATLSADLTLEPGSEASPTIYWASKDGAVATVGASGATTTVDAVSPGTVDIFAAAGEALDQFTLQVLPRVSSVVVSPDPAAVDGVGATAQFSAAVDDGFGNPDPGALVTWSSADPSVATVDAASGLATAVGIGTTQITATSFGVSGSAALTVRGPDLVPVSFLVVPDVQGDIRLLEDTDFLIDVRNVGIVAAGASTLQVRILDAATLQQAHPPLSFPVPALAPGQTFALQSLGGAQIQPVTLPSALMFEAVADALGDVTESDEANNIATDGPFDVIPAAPPGFDVEWVGTTIDWATGSNWSTGQPPQPGENVYIGVSTTDPTLTTTADVNDLTVASGATLTINEPGNLVVRGDLDAGQTIVGSGVVQAAGVGSSIRGTIQSFLYVTGTVSASGPLQAGTTTIGTPGASLTVNGQSVLVTGNLSTTNGGVLVMNAPSDFLVVDGGVYFDGGSTDGLLTSGSLVVGGDFTATDNDNMSFAASGTHTTVLAGSVAQGIQFDVPGETQQRFQNLIVDAEAPVTALSAFSVLGDLAVLAEFDVGPRSGSVGGSASVTGSLTVPSGGSLAITDALVLGTGSILSVDGDITAGAGCTDNGATITGSGTHPCSGPPPGSLAWVGGDATSPNDWATAANWNPQQVPGASSSVLIGATANPPILDANRSVGDLTIQPGAALDLGTNSLDVNGDLDSQGGVFNGDLYMVGAGGTVQGVVDNLFIDNVSSVVGQLTLSGSLVVRQPLALSGAQIVNVGASLTLNGLGRLEIDNPSAIVSVTGGAEFLSVNQEGYLNQGVLLLLGNLTAFGPGSFAPDAAFRTVFNGSAAQTIYFQDPAPTSSRLGRLEILSAAVVDLVSNVDVLDDVLLSGELVVETSYQLTIQGQLSLASGSTLSVNGVVSAVGGCVNNGGTVTGTGTHPCSAGPAFDRTWIGGDAGGPTNWSNANNWSPVGVPGGTESVLVDVTVNGPVLSAPSTVGSIAVRGGQPVDLNGLTLTVNGGIEATRAITGGVVVVAGAGSGLQGTVDDLVMNVGRSVSAPLSVLGDLTLSSGNFDLAGQLVTVDGNLSVQGTAILQMNTGAGFIDVAGDVDFSGGNHGGWMTQGVLGVGGNFTTSGAAGAFVGTTNHQVIFSASQPAQLSFGAASTTGQRFSNVQFANSAPITMESDWAASGTVVVDPGSSVVDGCDCRAYIAGGYVDDAQGLTPESFGFYGNLSVLPAVISRRVLVQSSLVLPNSTSVPLGLTILSDLNIGQYTLASGDNVFVSNSGQLRMQNAAGLFDIEGDLTMDGISTSGWLTAGEIRIAGDLTVAETNSNLSFIGTSSHTVTFDGTGPQAVSFTSPATTEQRFQNVTFANTGALTFGSDFVATGTVTVNPGTTVNAAAAAVSIAGGFVDANNGMSLGQLVTFGNLTAVPAIVPTSVVVNAPWNLPGSSSITGSLTLNQYLSIGANTLAVAGNLSVLDQQLRMQNAAGIVDVAGDALFDGVSSSGWLTQGELRIGGDMIVGNTNTTLAFVGTSQHTTVFDGLAPQVISFTDPAINAQRFANLTFESGTATTFASDVVAMGTLTLVDGANVDAADDLVSIGAAYVDPGNGLVVPQINVEGNLTAVPASILANVVVNQPWNLPNATAVTGDMTLNQYLNVGANTIAISGGLTVLGGAQLRMQSSGGVVDVAGDVSIDGGTSSGWLTQGVLRIAGDLAVAETSTNQSFVAQSGHTVELDGGGPQTVSFSSPSITTQRFQNLTITGGSSVSFTTDVVATGLLTVVDGTIVDAADVVVTVGTGYTDPGNGMQVLQLVTVGSLSVMPVQLFTNVVVNGATAWPNDTDITGGLTVNADLTLGPVDLGVSQNFTVQGAGVELRMQAIGAVLDVGGDVLFAGGPSSGWLIQGEIQVGGDFTAASTNSPASFVAQQTHTVRFDGTGPQLVDFSAPGTAGQRFQNVAFVQGGTVTFNSDVVASGAFTVQDASTVDASDDVVSIGGSYVDPGNDMTVQELRVTGNLTSIPATLATRLFVDGAFTLPNGVTLTGDLTLNNQFSLGGNRVLMTGNFASNGAAARLVMQNAGDTLDVAGSVTFNGGTESGWLTNGFLRLTGDFTATASNAQSFASTVAHTTVFLGAAPQVIDLANPGTTGQRFNNLTNENFNNPIQLASTVVVTGILLSDDVFFARQGAGAVLDARGTVNVQATTFTGLPLRVTSNVAPNLHTLASVTFETMDPADVQLFLSLPGAGANSPLLAANLVFDTPNFTTGAHVQTERSTGAADFVLQLQGAFPNPVTGLQGAFTQIQQF